MAQSKIRVLVTAGPTRAYLDRVRYISNYSTGELGYEVARELSRKQCSVAVIAGPTNQPWDNLALRKFSEVETHTEMLSEVLLSCRQFQPHVAIFSAAVLDFAPAITLEEKVSSKKTWTVKLVPTPKIIDIVDKKFQKVRKIGFKLEWKTTRKKDRERFALEYLKKKNLEVLCLNYLSEISRTTHPIYFYNENGLISKSETKIEAAKKIVSLLGPKIASLRSQ